MQIESIAIKNIGFSAIRSWRTFLGFVLVGANGTGKSTLFDVFVSRMPCP